METSNSATARGLLRSLYDFGFTSLIAAKVIRFVYALLVIVYSVVAAILLVAAIAETTRSAVAGVIAIVLVPIGYIISLIWLRIVVEVLIVFFGMGADVRFLRSRGLDSGRDGVATVDTSSASAARSAIAEVEPTQTRPSEPVQETRSVPIQAVHAEPTQATPSSQPDGVSPSQAVRTEEKESPQAPVAGWYDAPGDPTQYRYWDGAQWTQHFRPKGDQP